VALSATTKEVIFVKQVLETMGYKVNDPILIKVDNMSAIYLSNNHSLSQQTKHINIQFHFVREFFEEGVIKTIYVGTYSNDADIQIKNTPESFKKHKEYVQMIN
jgi:hypothetical protein